MIPAMKIARVAYLVIATRAIAVATARGPSKDRALIVREELSASETVPETAEDIWGKLTGDNNCLGCQVRLDHLEDLPCQSGEWHVTLPGNSINPPDAGHFL